MLERRGLEGDVESQGMAGMMHLMGSRLYGDQVPTDPERAARWLRAAALNDSVEAMFILAQLYQQGIGVPLDSDRADRWLTQLAANSFVFTIAQAAER
jgi:TPR repeat protein